MHPFKRQISLLTFTFLFRPISTGFSFVGGWFIIKVTEAGKLYLVISLKHGGIILMTEELEWRAINISGGMGKEGGAVEWLYVLGSVLMLKSKMLGMITLDP